MLSTTTSKIEDVYFTNFRGSSEYAKLRAFDQLLLLSRLLLDVQKKRTHLLVVIFFEFFCPGSDENIFRFKLFAFKRLLKRLQLEVPADFDAIVMEHLRDCGWAADLRPCLVCDRWSYRYRR